MFSYSSFLKPSPHTHLPYLLQSPPNKQKPVFSACSQHPNKTLILSAECPQCSDREVSTKRGDPVLLPFYDD